jgi:hypothetical protein
VALGTLQQVRHCTDSGGPHDIINSNGHRESRHAVGWNLCSWRWLSEWEHRKGVSRDHRSSQEEDRGGPGGGTSRNHTAQSTHPQRLESEGQAEDRGRAAPGGLGSACLASLICPDGQGLAGAGACPSPCRPQLRSESVRISLLPSPAFPSPSLPSPPFPSPLVPRLGRRWASRL